MFTAEQRLQLASQVRTVLEPPAVSSPSATGPPSTSRRTETSKVESSRSTSARRMGRFGSKPGWAQTDGITIASTSPPRTAGPREQIGPCRSRSFRPTKGVLIVPGGPEDRNAPLSLGDGDLPPAREDGVPPVRDAPYPSPREGIGSFLTGALLGDFAGDDSWSAVGRQTAIGFGRLGGGYPLREGSPRSPRGTPLALEARGRPLSAVG